MYLAWTPLTPGQVPPHPSLWRFYKADAPTRWVPALTIPAGQSPTPLLNSRRRAMSPSRRCATTP
ncbi:MAG: hypothetical protein R2712_27260 [Vicinamibacterales bacterium]